LDVHIIGVIDLRGGLAVHARGGYRDRYAPVTAVGLASIAAGDAVALARAYASLGISQLYVADLDAITTGTAAKRDDAVSAVVDLGLALWLDAGVSSVASARRALDLGTHRVVVGLETMTSYDVLEEICIAIGGDRVAFSLDLRHGVPVRALEDPSPREGGFSGAPGDAATIAARAASAGVASIIVLDLTRVGSSAGLDEPLLARIRRAAPTVQLIAGGGVRGPGDLESLARLGFDGALVATALLNGQLTGSDIASARHNTITMRHERP
jgi:phosphoribosylformimino-5-aminoimidazole carboxamide ribotide isomerase